MESDGVWYVVETSLDVWKPAGGRICPALIYEPIEPSEKEKKGEQRNEAAE